MTYQKKLKKMKSKRVDYGFSLYLKHCQFNTSEKEFAARKYFNILLEVPDHKKRAKKLGLI